MELTNDKIENFIDFLRNEDFKLLEHSVKVSILAQEFGTYLNLQDEVLYKLKVGAYLHDIGKISVPVSILNKPSKLTDKEYEIIKKHSIKGCQILESCGFIDNDILEIAKQHHERIDGSGYPLGLCGKDINYLSKIVSICDVYEALTAVRPYKESMSELEAVFIIKKGLGTQFDYELGLSFLDFLESSKIEEQLA